MALKLENINNLIADDLASRNENWTEIDTTFELKADKSTTYTKTEVDTKLSEKADKQQEEWISPTLINGATGTVQYRKNQFGRVEYRGYVTTESPFVDAFVLPAGYRYSGTQNVLLTIGESSDSGYIRIYNMGHFRPYLATKYNLNSLSYIGN